MPFVVLLQSNVPNSALPAVVPGGGYNSRLTLMGVSLLTFMLVLFG